MKTLRTAPLLLAALGYGGLANADPGYISLNGSTETRLFLSVAGQDEPLVLSDRVPDTIKFRVAPTGQKLLVQYNLGKGWETGCQTTMTRYGRAKLDPDRVPFVVNKTVREVEQGACQIPGLGMTLDGAATVGDASAMVVVSRFYGYTGQATELNVAYSTTPDGKGVYGNVVYADHNLPYVLSMK